ncbi:hypothetical protein E2C01_093157 [Portunus trituberculatus]|uniref:Uncharacterized protein n=1 Tax=Portunus trituberculatus TaxID=210409 RepID=A0A5B7JP24_PORTR|nr:hypothetical protein [Portunus trituberculatus]
MMMFKIFWKAMLNLSNDEFKKLDKASQEAKKREMRKKNLCMAWTSKLLENVSVVSKKALETLKERDPNPARSSKGAHDVEKSVKIYQEIYDEKTKLNSPPFTCSSSQSDMLSLSHLPTLLQLALPQYPLSSNK